VAEADARVTGGGVRVDLVSPGAEPRRSLRYLASAVAQVKLQLDYEVAMVQTTRGDDPSARPVPALSLDVTLSREATGLGLTVDGARATPDGDAEKLLAEEVAPLLKQLVGKSGTLALSERGVTGTSVTRPGGLEREVLQIWSSLDETTRDLVPPLPEEAIGVGARWRAVQRLRRGGLPLLRTVEYELLAGKGVPLKLVVKEQPIADKAQDPLMPEGMSVTARGGVGEGTGTLELDGELLPRAASLSLDSLTEITIAGPPGGAPLETMLRLKQTVRVKARP